MNESSEAGSRNNASHEIFLNAVEIPDGSARAEFVNVACHGDAELQREVEHLLEHYSRAGQFLESPLLHREQVCSLILAGPQLPGLTLEPTALVHEAWLKLQKSDAAGVWKDRRHLCSTVAAVMWQILIDRSRRPRTERHGGHLSRADKDLQQIAAETTLEELMSLASALERLSTEHPELAEIVQL